MVILIWITAVLFSPTDCVEPNHIHQPDPVISAAAGDNVTLRCFRTDKENTDPIIWYKQAVGREPRVMVTAQKVVKNPVFEERFKSPRFSVKVSKGSCHLKINRVEPSDEAVYYCGLKLFNVAFGTGTFLSVRDGGGVNVSVVQSGESDPVPAGGSVTLQCSVLSESRSEDLRVLWFRAASPPSRPQILYAHRHDSQRCESGSSTHTCLYNFSQNVVGLEDSGVYYCAVTLCRSIVFGSGTRLQLVTSSGPGEICLAVVVAVCAVVIFAQALTIWKMRNCDKSTVRPEADSITENKPNRDVDGVELNYGVLHFNTKNQTTREARKRDEAADCVYSEVSCST